MLQEAMRDQHENAVDRKHKQQNLYLLNNHKANPSISEKIKHGIILSHNSEVVRGLQ